MQRRLVEQLKDLEGNIQSIKDKYADGTCQRYNIGIEDDNWQQIFNILYKLLSASDKSFEVTFKGLQFNFIYPTTPEEKEEMHHEKNILIDRILFECSEQMYDGKDTWWMVTAFASGVDALDMQIEIVGKEEHLNIVDDKGQRVKALPINESNYQVKQEMEYDTPDQLDNL